jgi:hypothetical protein
MPCRLNKSKLIEINNNINNDASNRKLPLKTKNDKNKIKHSNLSYSKLVL